MKHDNKGENAKPIAGAVSTPKGDGSQKAIAGSIIPGPKDTGLGPIQGAVSAPKK